MERGIKIPAIILLVLKGVCILVGAVVIIFQNRLVPLLYTDPSSMPKTMIFPLSSIGSILSMIFCIIFVCVIFNYKGSHKTGIGIFFMIFNVVFFGIISFGLSFASNLHFIATNDNNYLVKLNNINLLINYCTMAIAPFTGALFYYICGRYAISKKEKNVNEEIQA